MDFFELKLFKIKVKGIIEEVNETIKKKDNQKYTRLSSTECIRRHSVILLKYKYNLILNKMNHNNQKQMNIFYYRSVPGLMDS